jgi:hypothetical protein
VPDDEEIETTSALFSAEAAVDALRAHGRNVIQGRECWWYNAYGQNRLYYSFPVHHLVTPSAEELAAVFAAAPRALAVRYLSPAGSRLGRRSFIWVCREPYTIEGLKSKDRNTLKKGLKNCSVRRVSFAELNEQGNEANRDTQERQGLKPTRLNLGPHYESDSTYEAWAAFVEDKLASYLIVQRLEDWVYVQVHRSANAYLRYQPNNALIYEATRDFLARPGVTTVCYGWEPLYPMASLARFKLSVGFVQEPIRQRAVFAPRYRWLFNELTCRLVERAATKIHGNHRWQTIGGICRFALND